MPVDDLRIGWPDVAVQSKGCHFLSMAC